MKIEINTSAKNVELANYVLSEALDSLKRNQKIMKGFGLDKKDIESVERFRKSLIKGLLR